ncbi:MAG: hypothetical protein ABI216_04175 [Devosia sp.]
MTLHHLISIPESALRDNTHDQAEHERVVGAAVIAACLDPGSREKPAARSVSIRHVDECDGDDFKLYVWRSGSAIYFGALSDDDLLDVIKIAEYLGVKKDGASVRNRFLLSQHPKYKRS